jgi:hypothetical protein
VDGADGCAGAAEAGAGAFGADDAGDDVEGGLAGGAGLVVAPGVVGDHGFAGVEEQVAGLFPLGVGVVGEQVGQEHRGAGVDGPGVGELAQAFPRRPGGTPAPVAGGGVAADQRAEVCDHVDEAFADAGEERTDVGCDAAVVVDGGAPGQ